MSSIASIPIRLELTTRSTPPIPPLDANTGETPQVWGTEDLEFQIGVFDPSGFPVDLSNLAFLEIDIFPYPLAPASVPGNQSYAPFANQPFPTVPPAPILNVTVEAADITALISRAGWDDGTQQNAIALFSWVDVQGLNLSGQEAKRFGILVHGLTNAGKKIVYGGGPLTIYQSPAENIYLPNGIAPLTVPELTILYVQPNQQLTYSIPIDVEGTIVIEGTLVQV